MDPSPPVSRTPSPASSEDNASASGVIQVDQGQERSSSERSGASDTTLDVDTVPMVYVVTGANCGIGFETVRRLVRREGEKPRTEGGSAWPRKDIVLACKDLTAAHEAMKKLSKFCNDDNTVLHAMQLELGNSVSVRNFGIQMETKFSKVDCLVCNAGVLVPVPKATDRKIEEAVDRRRLIETEAPEGESNPSRVGEGDSRSNSGNDVPAAVDDVLENAGLEPEKNPDGFEMNVGTNHLGHVLLVTVLMPLLLNAPTSRVVIVSSSLLKKATLRMEMMQPTFKERQDTTKMDIKAYYAESKLMNALFARALKRELERRGIDTISVYSVSPGWCKTQLHRYSDTMPSCCLPCISLLALCFMRSARKGSDSVYYVATEDPTKLSDGSFYKNRVVDPTVESFLDITYGGNVLEDLFAKSQDAIGSEVFPRSVLALVPTIGAHLGWQCLCNALNLSIFSSHG